MNLLLSCLSLSLFDSLSTAQQIIIFVLLLNTRWPIRNTLTYLAGLLGTYFLAGVIGCIAFVPLQQLFKRLPFSTSNVSDTRYYLAEVLAGLVMVGIGLRHFFKHRHAKMAGSEVRLLDRITARFGHIGRRASFLIGVFISATTLPCSVPYFVALGKISGAHLGTIAGVRYVLFYNLVYASPMLGILGIYLWLSHRFAGISQAQLHEKARLLNLHLTTWTIAGVGLLSVLDGGAFFLVGHALIKGRLL